jgi:hypothetical protein
MVKGNTDDNQRLKSKWDIGMLYPNTYVMHSSVHNKNNNAHESRFDFVHSSEEGEVTQAFGVSLGTEKTELRYSVGWVVRELATFCGHVEMEVGKRSISQLMFGALVKPFWWWEVWAVHSSDSLGFSKEWAKQGHITVMNRLTLREKTQLALDYYWATGRVNYVLGIENHFGEKWFTKAKIGSSCDFEMLIRYRPYTWIRFVFGMKGEYHDVIEKQN